MPTPSERSASIISRLSRECSGARSVPGPSASAARISSRPVSDFDPGSGTTASSGSRASGAAQAAVSSPAPSL